MATSIKARREPRYVSLQRAAEYVDGCEKTIRRLIHRGELTRFGLGRHIRIDLNELDDVLRGTRSA